MPHLAVRALKIARDNQPHLCRRVSENAATVGAGDERVRRGRCGVRSCGWCSSRRWSSALRTGKRRFGARVLGSLASCQECETDDAQVDGHWIVSDGNSPPAEMVYG